MFMGGFVYDTCGVSNYKRTWRLKIQDSVNICSFLRLPLKISAQVNFLYFSASFSKRSLFEEGAACEAHAQELPHTQPSFSR
jgi:hypothetical protein